MWRLPTVNLAVASEAARRRNRAQWGAFLDAMSHEVQIVVRARWLQRLQAVYEVFEHGSDEAKALAKWLHGHLGDPPLIARDRRPVISAPDHATLASRCSDIRSSMAQFDWRPVEPESYRDLERLINGAWPVRLNIDRVAPAMVLRKQGELVVDREYVRTYALAGSRPRSTGGRTFCAPQRRDPNKYEPTGQVGPGASSRCPDG